MPAPDHHQDVEFIEESLIPRPRFMSTPQPELADIIAARNVDGIGLLEPNLS